MFTSIYKQSFKYTNYLKYSSKKDPFQLFQQVQYLQFSSSENSELIKSKNQDGSNQQITKSKDKDQLFDEDDKMDLGNLTFKDLIFSFKKKDSNIIHQPESKTTIKFDEDSEYKANTDIELQLKDNPLALKVLKEGEIDLRDERIKVKSLNLTDAGLLDASAVNNLRQIDLGEVKVLPKDHVMLDDIDVYNIPDDKDIVVEKENKQMYAIGTKINKSAYKVSASIEEDEQEGESKSKDIEDVEKKKYVHSISKTIFEEKNYQEFSKENLFNFEGKYFAFNYKQLLRQSIAFWPVQIFIMAFMYTIIEVYTVQWHDFIIEDQFMQGQEKSRQALANKALMDSPYFNRVQIQKLQMENSSKDILPFKVTID